MLRRVITNSDIATLEGRRVDYSTIVTQVPPDDTVSVGSGNTPSRIPMTVTAPPPSHPAAGTPQVDDYVTQICEVYSG